ncbi:MAG: cytochrome C oxidase subunit IV family protein [Nitriliruptoraceae bacterium]|nr:cytochrome C oxidase subunit IV family protein [Nitriliruptoraceae bacterium]
MSTTEAAEATDQHDAHDHPTPRQYVNIAVVLAVLTALEVSTYFFDFGVIAIPLLVVLMIVKFIYVAGWFMHLKFDSPIFSRMMYGGLTLALVLYALTITVILLDQAPTL